MHKIKFKIIKEDKNGLIFNKTALVNKKTLVSGRKEGWESRVKDCLQQSKIFKTQKCCDKILIIVADSVKISKYFNMLELNK